MLQKLIQRVIDVLFKPTEVWKKIQGENWTVPKLYFEYALILGAIPAVAGFIGYSLVGTSVLGVTFRYPVVSAIVWQAIMYGFSMGTVFVVALIMDLLAPTFGAQKDMLTSLKITVFSWTAIWVGGIFQIIPTLAPLSWLASIYTAVLLFFGMKAIRNVPADKLVGYYVVTLVVSIVILGLATFLAGIIALPSIGASVAAMGH